MLRMAEEHDNIVVTGEVADLFALIARIPIVINPMRSGGGLKNSVLESMALERLVISNRLGIEAVDAVRDVHRAADRYLALVSQTLAPGTGRA